MKKNIGTTDRIIRLGLGVILFLAIGFVKNEIAQWVLFVASIFCIFQAATGWCALYALLGKNTCPIK